MTPLEASFDQRTDNLGVLWLKGSADIANHDNLQSFIKPVKEGGSKNVVLDIRQLQFVTSLAIGEFLALSRAKKQAGGKVTIAGPNEYVSGVFAKARLTTVIPVFATLDEAVEACNAG